MRWRQRAVRGAGRVTALGPLPAPAGAGRKETAGATRCGARIRRLSDRRRRARGSRPCRRLGCRPPAYRPPCAFSSPPSHSVLTVSGIGFPAPGFRASGFPASAGRLPAVPELPAPAALSPHHTLIHGPPLPVHTRALSSSSRHSLPPRPGRTSLTDQAVEATLLPCGTCFPNRTDTAKKNAKHSSTSGPSGMRCRANALRMPRECHAKRSSSQQCRAVAHDAG